MYNNSKKTKIKRKTKNMLIHIIFSRFFVVFLLVVFEFVILFRAFYMISSKFRLSTIILFNLVVTIFILNISNLKNTYKISWIILINILPGAGLLLYFYYLLQKNIFFGSRKLNIIVENSKKYYKQFSVLNDKFVNKSYKNPILNYFENSAGFCSYYNNECFYFDNGSDYFDDLLNELKKAKHYIFIETFILTDGIIWNDILNILIDKSKNGVEVKLMFDGLNSLYSFDINYIKKLKQYGIDAKMFSAIIPFLSSNNNNRDHRKIIVIDGKIAYTGGINIADEYANLYERFGIWKDSGIKVVGNAVNSFVIMFLQIWYMTEKNKNNYIFDKYLYNKFDNYKSYDYKSDDNVSYIIPYTDYPGDIENVTEQLFRMLINYSFEKLYIMTPYLILDEELLDCFILSKKRGVDVKIFTPHIPDKKLIFYVTRCNYKYLLDNGIEIYEYTDGFVHSKVILSDNINAYVGTANLDLRSLYLHYENGVYIYNDKCIKQIEDDFNNLINNSKRIIDLKQIPIYQKFIGSILKIFASQF